MGKAQVEGCRWRDTYIARARHAGSGFGRKSHSYSLSSRLVTLPVERTWASIADRVVGFLSGPL